MKLAVVETQMLDTSFNNLLLCQDYDLHYKLWQMYDNPQSS